MWTPRSLFPKGTVSPQTLSPDTQSRLYSAVGYLHRTALARTAPYCILSHALRCTHMHRTASHRTDMHSTASYCTYMHRTTSYCSHMHRTALTCTALHHTALTCTVLQNTAFTRTELHHTALICTALHHIVLMYTATMHCQQHVLTTATLGRITLCKTSNLTRWPAALPPGMQLWCSYCSMHSGAYSTPTSGDGSSMCRAVTAHRSGYCSAAFLYRAATVQLTRSREKK